VAPPLRALLELVEGPTNERIGDDPSAARKESFGCAIQLKAQVPQRWSTFGDERFGFRTKCTIIMYTPVMKRSRVCLALITLAVSCAPAILYSQATGQVLAPANAVRSGEWVGARTSGGHSQALVLHIDMTGGGRGTVDLPDFGALGVPAAKFEVTKNHIHFDLVGDTSTAVFDGSISPTEIHGHWKEGDRTGDFILHPSNKRDSGSALLTKNVSVQNGDVRLSGTLVMPHATEPLPVIVFVQGAGPETRAASLFLAEYFAHRGIAAFIYDKRGAGESSGDWKHASFEALAGDVEAVVQFLGKQPEIDAHRIGLMGSSQGGWIAPMAALHLPDIAFVISKSAAPVTPEQQELARVARYMAAEGDSPADIAEGQSLYKNAIAYARSGMGWSPLQQQIQADAGKKWAFFAADTPKDYWFFDQIRSFFAHDPILVLRQVRCPLLVIFGGKDEDAPPLETDIGPLLNAMQANRKDSQLVIFPGAGHDMRIVPENNGTWDFGRFAPGYLPLLGSWVDAKFLTY
jgi:pimeloyl-ACP methyl ester carboxylesterase